MEKSLQEGHVCLQASRDEGRAGIAAVGMPIVKEKAGQSQGLKFPSKSKLHPRSNQGCLSPFHPAQPKSNSGEGENLS